MKIPFYIVDVFAQCRFSGNQLAVIIKPSELPDEKMQDIAERCIYTLRFGLMRS
jgi:trans-2,3-dihydro-3-hydroxyanthranilate isomerase